MKMRYRIFAIIALLVGTCLTVQAAEEIHVKRGEPQRVGDHWEEQAECAAPVREGARLVVRADMGSISVNPGPANRMECRVRLRAFTPNEAEARRNFRNYQLSLQSLEAGGAYLSGKVPQGDHRPRSLGAEFDITVPLRFNLDMETKGGSIEVQNLEGELKAATAGGDIRSGDVAGPVRVETAGGSINLGRIGNTLEARTAGGSIRTGDVKGAATLQTSGGEIVVGFVQGGLQAETAGGDLVLRGASGPVQARTAGGQIRVGDCGSSVRAQTAGGSIQLQGARGEVEAKTAGGSIDLLQVHSAIRATTAAGSILAQIDANQKTFAASELKTSVGDIQVYLPPNLPLTIDATIDMAAGHKIISDFPLNIQGEEKTFVPATLRGEGALNGGGAVLRMQTVGGNIEIRKLDARTVEELRARQESLWKRWQEREDRRQQREEERRERRQQ
jgi:DUF4097 and DUF4098 domain-containing protein YvlB